MWASPETTWAARPQRFARSDRAQDPHDFSAARPGRDHRTSGAARSGRPCTACRRSASCAKGLWVASGFGRQGLNTSAMAGQLIARSILWGDERWRLFSPFELVWAGGRPAGSPDTSIGMWGRGSSAAAGALARYRERARVQERVREARLAEANRQAANAAGHARRPPPGRPRPVRPPTGCAAGRGASAREPRRGGGRCMTRNSPARKKVRNFDENSV